MMSVKQASELWGVSERRVRLLCQSGSIPGAVREGKRWLLPNDSLKPHDRRRRPESDVLEECLDPLIDRSCAEDHDLLKVVKALSSIYTDIISVDLNLGSFRVLRSRYLPDDGSSAAGFDAKLSEWLHGVLRHPRNLAAAGILALESLRCAKLSGAPYLSVPAYVSGADEPMCFTVCFNADRAVVALAPSMKVPRYTEREQPISLPPTPVPECRAPAADSAHRDLASEYLSGCCDCEVLALFSSADFACPVWRLGGTVPDSLAALSMTLSGMVVGADEGRRTALSRFFDPRFIEEFFSGGRARISTSVPLLAQREVREVYVDTRRIGRTFSVTVRTAEQLLRDPAWLASAGEALSHGFDMIWIVDRSCLSVSVIKPLCGIPAGYHENLGVLIKTHLLRLLEVDGGAALKDALTASGLHRPMLVKTDPASPMKGATLSVVEYSSGSFGAICFKILN